MAAPIVTETGSSFVVKNHKGLSARGPLPGVTIPDAGVVTLDHTDTAQFYSDGGFGPGPYGSVTEVKALLERNGDLITAYYTVRGIGDGTILNLRAVAPLRTTNFSGVSDYKGYGVSGYADLVLTWDSTKQCQAFSGGNSIPLGEEAVVCFRVTYSVA
jgi:hypothetical protein